MKKRLMKKKAKMFLAGKVAYPVCYDYRVYNTDGDYDVILFHKLPCNIRREAMRIARHWGWEGNWDNAPDIIAINGLAPVTDASLYDDPDSPTAYDRAWLSNPYWDVSQDEIERLNLIAYRDTYPV